MVGGSVDDESSKGLVSCAHPDYDSETLRRAADKNREVSRKLFSRLRQKERDSRASPRHDRQGSGQSSDGGESPGNKRSLTKSPSQLSSIYAESSSGSSGIGTLTQSVSSSSFHKEYTFTPPMHRSTSSETLTAGARNGTPPDSSSHGSVSAWNTPQHRGNILTLAEDDGRRDSGGQGSEFMSHSGRTPSSVAASRGVSRKISSRKKAAREELECMRSMPDLCNRDQTQVNNNPEDGSPIQRIVL